MGIGIFSAAALVGFGYLNTWLVYQGAGKTTMVWVFGVVFCLVMAANWIDIFLRTDPDRVSEDDRRRKLCIQRGTASYLQGDLAVALGEFRECLKIEPNCPEALFRIGVLAARQEDFETARSGLRRALRYDVGGKWKWEIEREFIRLDAGMLAQAEVTVDQEEDGELREKVLEGGSSEREEEAEHASA